MRKPTWEASPGSLTALLHGLSQTRLYMVDLFTVTRDGSIIARWTDADHDVTINGQTYKKDPIIERETVSFTIGVEVASLSVEISPSQHGTLINGVPLLRFAAQKGFDNCRIRLERAFAQSPQSEFVGILAMFDGRVSSPTVTRGRVSMSVKSDLELLDAPVPANVYQPACMNTCYDSACRLARVEHSTKATGISNDRRTEFPINLSKATNDYFALGTVRFVTGANAGITRSIRSSTANKISLMASLPAPVSNQDQIVLVRGCNRTKAACQALGNFKHFRGCPYIPIPETII